MIEYTSNQLLHWNYFIALEKDAEITSRYVEICPENENTYSIEYSKLLMSASSEVDVIMKEICQYFAMNDYNINAYSNCIRIKCASIIDEEYFIKRYSLKCKPFSNWSTQESNPDWWVAYNNVKHHRNINFIEANQKNTLNAVGALLICNIYLLTITSNTTIELALDSIEPKSSFFTLNNKYYYENVRYLSNS